MISKLNLDKIKGEGFDYIMGSTVVSSHYGNLKNSKHSDLTIGEKK
jgi:hypothetical protein